MNLRTIIGIVLGLIFIVPLFGNLPHRSDYMIAGGILLLLPASILIWSGIRQGNSKRNESSVYKLFEAILKGNINEIKLQLNKKADPKAKYGFIWLFFENRYVLANREEMRLLKNHSLSKILKVYPPAGQRVPCPVSLATASEFAQALLKESDKPSLYKEILDLLYAFGYMPPYGYLSIELCEAVEKNDLITVEALLKRKADMNANNSSGDSPIHIAVNKGYLGIIKLIVRSGANINAKTRFWSEKIWEETVEMTAIDYNGQGHYRTVKGGELTPLMLAVKSNNLELVKYLVENGALLNEADANGDTAIKIAQERQADVIIDLLQKGIQ